VAVADIMKKDGTAIEWVTALARATGKRADVWNPQEGCSRAGRIAVHAAKGMTRGEYEDAADFMRTLGVECPRPDALIRGGIIGAVTVEAIVKEHPSPWFFGPRGLVLSGAEAVAPIAAQGALGFFYWDAGGGLEKPLPWMIAWLGRAAKPLPLFAGSGAA
jgi:hypothetical protein